jgi:uncharacterized membrane protein
MSDEKYSMFLTVYKGKDTADEVYDVLRGLEKAGTIDLKSAATVYRKDNGKLKLKHKRRVTVWKGGFGGAAIGLLLAGTGAGLLAGAVVGAAVGTVYSKRRRETKKFLDDKLGSDDSALVVLVKDADYAAAQEKLDSYAGETIDMRLTPEAQEQIAALAADEAVAEAVAVEVEVEEQAVE